MPPPQAPQDQLAALPPAVIALIPRPLAERYRAVPLRLHGNELHVCLAAPHDVSHADELAFALDCRVRPFVASRAAVDLALERYYGILPQPSASAAPLDGYRELGSAPHLLPPPVPAPRLVPPPPAPRLIAPPAPPPAKPDPLIAEQLGAVMTEADVQAAFHGYFSVRFPELVMLAVREGRVALVRAGSPERERRLSRPLSISLRPGTLLGSLTTRAQVNHQPHLRDPELLELFHDLGLAPTQVTIVSIFADGSGCYAVIGQGRDGDYVRRIFPDLRTFAAKAAAALRIVALRREIRGR